jgi:hypothetical protein
MGAELEKTVSKYLEDRNEIAIPKQQLIDLLEKQQTDAAELEEYKKDIAVLHSSSMDIMAILGLIDERTGKLKAGVVNGTENPMPGIFSAGSSLIALVGRSGLGDSSAKRKLEEKFKCLKELLPLLEKHGNK